MSIVARDRPDAGARAAEAADRGDRRGGIDVRRQVQDHRRHARRSETSRSRSTRPAPRRSRSTPSAPAASCRGRRQHDDDLRAVPDRPSAPDEPARDAAAGEVAEIRRQKRHPERQQAVFESVAARHEIDREPVGDEEPDRIGQRLADDDAPGLRQREKRAVRQRRRSGSGAARRGSLRMYAGAPPAIMRGCVSGVVVASPTAAATRSRARR